MFYNLSPSSWRGLISFNKFTISENFQRWSLKRQIRIKVDAVKDQSVWWELIFQVYGKVTFNTKN